MDPLDPAVAQTIVAEYAALLETHTQQDVYPASIETLPYPKEVIKTAIRTSVLSLTATDQLTGELRDFLEVSYMSLADYVDDELVRLLVEYRAAGVELSADGRLAREKVRTPAWNTLATSSRLAGEIARNIAQETEALRREFRQIAQTPAS